MINRLKEIEKLKKLSLRTRKVLEGVLLGLHSSPFHGYSSEFREHREYSPGDDIRYIDWKLFAKREKFFTKKFSEETNTRVYFLLDSSSSMGYGKPSKLEYSKVVISTLSYISFLQRDAPSLYVFSESERAFIPPKATRGNVENIIKTLEKVEAEGKTNPNKIFEYLVNIIKKRSIVFLFSDFYHDPQGFIKGLSYLKTRGNLTISVNIITKEELSLSYNQGLVFKDAETGEEFEVIDRKILEKAKDGIEEFYKTLREELFSKGIKNFTFNTSISYEEVILRIIKEKL